MPEEQRRLAAGWKRVDLQRSRHQSGHMTESNVAASLQKPFKESRVLPQLPLAGLRFQQSV